MDYDGERNWKKERTGATGVGGGGDGGRGGERKPSITSSSSLIDAARAAGLDIAPSGSDPMSSISALLAAAQATGGLPPSCSSPAEAKKAKPSTAGPSAPSQSQGLDLSNPQTAMANVNVSLLFLLMPGVNGCFISRRRCRCITTCRNYKQREWEIPRNGRSVQSAAKLCTTGQRGTDTCAFILVRYLPLYVLLEATLVVPLYHLQKELFLSLPLFSGEKPYPCRFCGRRFRTNYNKLGHEKKCPDRHARAVLQPATPDRPSVVPSVVYR